MTQGAPTALSAISYQEPPPLLLPGSYLIGIFHVVPDPDPGGLGFGVRVRVLLLLSSLFSSSTQRWGIAPGC